MARLDGEVALITGAGTGIGRATARGRRCPIRPATPRSRGLGRGADPGRGREGVSQARLRGRERRRDRRRRACRKADDLCAVPWQGGAVRRGDGAHVREITSSFESSALTGATIEERLASIAVAFLRKVLVAETVGLIRAAVAEARRFPDLAASVSRMGLERGTEAVTQPLASLRNPTKYRRSRPTAAPPPRAIISAADADACAVRRAPHSAARRDRAACRANGGVLSCCMQTERNWLD